VLECVVNISEGRDRQAISSIADAAGGELLDVHSDADHHRSVLSLVGEDAPRRVAAEAIARVDLREHVGAHPRLGVVDVVPFVPLAGEPIEDAIAARNTFAAWLAETHDVPVFLYGPERSLPEVRRQAFRDLRPDLGPTAPHVSAGAACVGARPVLVAYNVWLRGTSVDSARAIASEIRGPTLRALGLAAGDAVQVSMNLVEPATLGPALAYDLVRGAVEQRGGGVARAELVGLVPRAVLSEIDPRRWDELDLDDARTIEARLERAGLD
jgi:glutamate formiminotransferase